VRGRTFSWFFPSEPVRAPPTLPHTRCSRAQRRPCPRKWAGQKVVGSRPPTRCCDGWRTDCRHLRASPWQASSLGVARPVVAVLQDLGERLGAIASRTVVEILRFHSRSGPTRARLGLAPLANAVRMAVLRRPCNRGGLLRSQPRSPLRSQHRRWRMLRPPTKARPCSPGQRKVSGTPFGPRCPAPPPIKHWSEAELWRYLQFRVHARLRE
jgi:hypothetical protein